MRISTAAMNRVSRLLLAVGLVLTWVRAGVQPTKAEPPAVVPARPQPTGSGLPKMLAAMDALRREIPRDSFDPQAIVQEVGREPEKLFAWVRDNTWWAPYPGALRGPAGVLLDRVGNSVDRSLLLAELLRQAGFSVRLARSPLDEAAAAQLAEKIRPCPGVAALPQRDRPSEQLRQQIVTCATQAGADPAELLEVFDRGVLKEERVSEELMQRTAEQTAILTAAMPPKAVDAAAARAQTVAALGDHWWVQYQQEGAWKDLDTLLPKSEPGQTLAAAKLTVPVKPENGSVALPDDARQDLSVRVTIEVATGAKAQLATVVSARLSAAEVAGVPITVANVPREWPAGVPLNSNAEPGALNKALLDQHRWLPLLSVGTRQIVDKAFTDTGELLTPSRFDGPADLGHGVGGGFGALTGDEGDAPSGQVTAEWIEFEFRVPGERARTVRHEIFDLVGPAAREAKRFDKIKIGDAERIQRSLKMLGPAHILPVASAPTMDYLAHMLLSQLQQVSECVDTNGQVDRDRATQVLAHAGYGHVALYQWAALRWHGGPSADAAYIDRLNLAIERAEPMTQPDGRLTAGDRIDVIANDVAVCASAMDRAFAVRMQQGVADTVAEDLCFDQASPMENTAGLVSLAAAEGSRPQVLRQQGGAALDALTPDARVRLRQDLSGGNAAALVCVKGTGKASMRCGWWRVDEKTGLTLGVLDNGYHAGAAERTIMDRIISVCGMILLIAGIVAVGCLVVYLIYKLGVAVVDGLRDAMSGTDPGAGPGTGKGNGPGSSSGGLSGTSPIDPKWARKAAKAKARRFGIGGNSDTDDDDKDKE